MAQKLKLLSFHVRPISAVVTNTGAWSCKYGRGRKKGKGIKVICKRL